SASLFFITPNGLHYFAAIAGLLARIRVQERVLRRLRSAELIGRYHYPAVYRLNTPQRIRRMGKEAGFASAEFRYCEHLAELTPYFPGPTRVLPYLWQAAVRATGGEHMLGNLMGRLVKTT